MGFRAIARIVAHSLSFRWAIFLLIGVTVVYLLISLLGNNSDLNSYKKYHVGGIDSIRRLSKTGKPATSAKLDGGVSEIRGIWVSDRNVQVISAIHDIHHANLSETRVVLPAFLQHSSDREFVCCFQASAEAEDYAEVSASLDFIDLRFIVNIQNAAFDCILKGSQINPTAPFKFVSFAPNSCAESRSPAMRIVYPVRRSWEFAVCTKVAYGKLDPARLVEWFEYMREVGASKIVTFHNNLHPAARRVFEHYAASGFLQLIDYQPMSARNGSRILYTEKNSQTYQARQEKTLVVRDCQYRLGGYDFVLTIDFDELPVPVRPYRSLNWIFQNLLKNHSDGAAFRMDPILLPPEWQDTGNQGRKLYHWKFTTGAYIAPYCVKWVYVPGRTWLAATHEIGPKKGYHTYAISQDVLHFLHFRTCKNIWLDVPCHNLTQTVKNELSLKRFTDSVLRSLLKLPLEDLVPDKEYVRFVRANSFSSKEKKQSLVNLHLTEE